MQGYLNKLIVLSPLLAIVAMEDRRVSLKYLSNACFFIFSIFQTDAFSHLD
jgi:hypothetical protein